MKLTMVSGTSLAYNASAYQVTGGEWDPTTIQWTNKPAADVLLEANISNNDRTKYQFSVLTAVQHWYDGDPTGQNENYGIMLRYYDETLTGYYNSVYSGDVVDTNSRPKLTITYQVSNTELDVDVGASRTLRVSGTTQTATWTSSDTSVATVDANGVVTGVKLGTAVITAYVGGNDHTSFTIRVTVADGVYYIKAGAGTYAGTSGQIAGGTVVSLQQKAASGRGVLNQLWKIAYLSNGYYSIRPLYKLDMGLCTSSDSPGMVNIQDIGTTDSLNGIPGINRWTITQSTDGYIFCCAGTSYMTMRYNAPYPGASIVTEQYSSTLDGFVWKLERVTSVTNQLYLMNSQSGAWLEDAIRYIGPGEKATLEDMGIVTSFVSATSINQTVSLVSMDPSVVSVNSGADTITGVQPGQETQIKIVHRHNGAEYVQYITIKVLLVANGTYYIRNWASDCYLDIENQNMSAGNGVNQSDYSGVNSQKWVVTHIGDEVYTIASANSSMNYYLGINGDSTADGAAAVLRNGTVSNGMKWKIELTSSGAYKLIPLTGMADNCVLTLVSGLFSSDIQQKGYADDGVYKDEWLLSPVSEECILEGQQTEVWCWAASARIMGSSCMDSYISQASAAVYVKNGRRLLFPSEEMISAATDGGTPYETKLALEYITGRDDVYNTYMRIYDEQTLRSLLNCGVPVLINRGWYEDGKRDSGHATVITDYGWNASAQVYVYTMLDPGYGGNVTHHSYAGLCNGQNVVCGDDRMDTGIWESVVGFEVGNYDQTISWPGV